MKLEYESELNKLEIFATVRAAAEECNLECYVVGGYVRDLILNRPSKDLDFVCIGSGIELATCVCEKLEGNPNLSIYKTFGTAAVHHRGYEYEFVGARKESYHEDSRNPAVEEGTLEEDQNRRDFTINALAISLNKSNYGQLIDPFEGKEDLRNMLIRTPLDPKKTFSDDPLRMMRAVRFASQLYFDIAPHTFEGIIAHSARIKIVSQERITSELNKIIMSPKPSYGFKLLFHAGLLELIFKEFVDLKGVESKNGLTHKDNFFHTLQVVDNVAEMSDNLWLRWAALLHDIAKPATKRFNSKVGWTFHGHEDLGAKWVPKIFRKLKLPLDHKMRYVQKLVRIHLRPIALTSSQVTDSAVRRLVFDAGTDINDLMTLCRADITSKNPTRVKKYLNNFRIVEEKIKEVEARDKITNFQPPVSGKEIMQIFNLPPSRIIGELKSQIKEAILDGKISNEREEAINYLLKIASKQNISPPNQ